MLLLHLGGALIDDIVERVAWYLTVIQISRD
jgi:hypothetical protein